MDTQVYLMGKKANENGKRHRTAFTDAFSEAVERKAAKEADKRKSLERKERRQDKRMVIPAED